MMADADDLYNKESASLTVAAVKSGLALGDKAVTGWYSDAAAMIGDRKKAAEQNAERELDEARARLDKKSEASAAEAQKQCGEISALAEKNRGAVIKKAAHHWEL